MNLAPVVIFTYNRFEHLKTTIEFLKANKLASETNVIIVSDGPSKQADDEVVRSIRNWAKQIRGFQSVELIFREQNYGAFNSVLSAEKEILKRYGKIICMEDDIVTSNNFLNYMNAGLDYYQDHPKVLTISGYCHPIKINKSKDFWVSPYPCPWGYATWEHKWKHIDYNLNLFPRFKESKELRRKTTEYGEFLLRNLKADFDKKIVAADARICAQMLMSDMVSIMPTVSKVQNIGHDGSGLHSKVTNKFLVDLDTTDQFRFKFDNNVEIDKANMNVYREFMKVPKHIKLLSLAASLASLLKKKLRIR